MTQSSGEALLGSATDPATGIRWELRRASNPTYEYADGVAQLSIGNSVVKMQMFRTTSISTSEDGTLEKRDAHLEVVIPLESFTKFVLGFIPMLSLNITPLEVQLNELSKLIETVKSQQS